MVRVKREAVRDAILAAAAKEFAESGYLKATVNAIAREAGTAPSNVYVYFASKLEIAIAVYEPWLKKEILALEQSVKRQRTKERKIRCLIDGLLRHIPDDPNGYTATLVQALATAKPTDVYNPELLLWTEEKIAGMFQNAIGDAPNGSDHMATAHTLMLIFDGVALRRNLQEVIEPREETLKAITDLVLMTLPMKAVAEPAG